MGKIDRALERALSAPFRECDLEWRLQSSGKNDGNIWASCLVYVNNRAIMNRLDECVGIARWKNEQPIPGPCGGLLQGVSIDFGGRWVTKWDGATNTDVSPVKGGISDAMKRAAVQWGIGRYLYNAPDGYAVISDSGPYKGKTKDGARFKWSPAKNMLEFVRKEFDTIKSSETDGFLEDINGCNFDELEGIGQRIAAASLGQPWRGRLEDAYRTRRAQFEIDNDNQ